MEENVKIVIFDGYTTSSSSPEAMPFRCFLTLAILVSAAPLMRAQLIGNPGFADFVAYSLAAGDFDGDGYTDLAAGAPGEYVGNIPHGAVHVLYGTPEGITQARQQLWTIETLGVLDEEKSVGLGDALVAGDFNGDGYDELAITGRGTTAFGPRGGIVYVVYGSPAGLDPSVGMQTWHLDRDDLCWIRTNRGSCTTSASMLDDMWGAALAAGDFNADGYDELAIGSPGLTVNGVERAGGVLVLTGDARGLLAEGYEFFTQNDPESIIDESETDDWFGDALEAGDINGDGFDDLAIGSPFEDIESANAKLAGGVNVLYGSGNGLTALGNQFLAASSAGTDSRPNEVFGSAMAIGHFSNAPSANPRFGDVAVGIPLRDADQSGGREGLVTFFVGTGAGLEAADQALVESENPLFTLAADEAFGAALEGGDFDGDGFDDLAAGLPQSLFGRGAFEIIQGMEGGLNTQERQFWTIDSLGVDRPICAPEIICDSATQADAMLGSTFAAGDFNMDGFMDLAVGAPSKARWIGYINDPPWTEIPRAGAFYVLYGSASGLSRENVQLWFQNTPPTAPVLVTPADNSELLVGGSETPADANVPFAIVWQPSFDPDSMATISYAWQISSSASFDDTLATFEGGELNQLVLTHGDLGDVLRAADVEYQGSVTWYHRVVAYDGLDYTPGEAGSIRLTRGLLVDAEHDELPVDAAILETFPNPASSRAHILFRTSDAGRVVLTLLDVRGAIVGRNASTVSAGSEGRFDLDVSHLPVGMYLYRISGGGLFQTGKLAVLR
ncbi:MAG: T9SS type A sorting domain-containing protein [Rhodothermales bacterium]